MKTSYRENVKRIENINFFDICTYAYNAEDDCYCPIWDTDGEILDITDVFYDTDEEKILLNNIIKPSENYLVFAYGVTWNGCSGYAFYNDIVSCFRRSYDFNIYVNNVSKNGKTLSAVEYSHDCPMGSLVYIIALTEAEYNKLKYADFEKVESFVEKHAAKL